MAFYYPRVPLLAPGTKVISDHMVWIVNAMNARYRNGPDLPWRQVYYLLSLFRQIRNSDGGSLFPPAAEYFEVYQMLHAVDAVYPVAGPGEPDGANLASIMPAFVFGSAALNLDSEDERIANENIGGVPLLLPDLSLPDTAEKAWLLGKLQRGSYDPRTGLMAAPAYSTATKHYVLQPATTSPHGNSWGDYMPTPVELGPCSDPLFQNYEIFFTYIGTGTPVYSGGGTLSSSGGVYKITYDGTCPDQASHVGYLGRTPRLYVVILNDGSAEYLPLNEWVEGPYTGGSTPRKTRGDHIHRVLNEFAAGFRGTPEERESGSWLEHAFDTQKFLTRQYQLAPNKGKFDGGSYIYPLYPKFVLGGQTTYSAGEYLRNNQTGQPYYRFAEGFVFGGCLVKSVRLNGSATLEFLNDGEVIQEVTLTPDGGGAFAEIVTFERPVRATPLEIRLKTAATFFGADGYIDIECSELMEYKPELHDLALVLRLASCRTTLVNGLDGTGDDTTEANELSNDYFATGCIRNVNGTAGPAGSIAEINTNAVFEAARQLSKGVRIIPRRNFIGYEVKGGKSICYFSRYAYGLSNDTPIDLFEGIAPERLEISSGAIKADRTYKVRDTGTVTYNGVTYAIGQTFIGLAGITEFTGTGRVFESEGIRANADREGYSNEWLMGHSLKHYNPSDTSEWKPDAYSDYWPLVERCQFMRTGVPGLKWQFDYGQSVSFAPEAPSGWRYAMGTNSFPCPDTDAPTCEERRRQRYKSCRIYEPDPEIESATVLIEGGEEVVRLQFKTRFHHHPDAPTTIGREVSYWDRDRLQAEALEYRTMENGLREYLVYLRFGDHCTRGSPLDLQGQGNSARGSSVWGFTDDPYGACFPHFYFVQLMPKPYVDGNNTQDSWDTKLWGDWWRQMDLRLKPMVEGFVDQLTSTTIGCESGVNALFNYHLESACHEAFGGRWFSTLASAGSNWIRAEDTRPDKPQGFGQLPNVQLSAEVYNQFAKVLNLLTKIRIMLPMQFQTRYTSGVKVTPVTAQAPDGTPLSCAVLGPVAGWWSGVPPDAPLDTVGAWADDTVLSAGQGAGIDMFSCDGTSWNLVTSRVSGEWRWSFTDPDAIHALPELWQDMVGTAQYGRVLAWRQRVKLQIRVAIADDVGDSEECHFVAGHWFDGTNYYKFNRTTVTESEGCEVISASGSFQGPTLGFNDLAIGRDAGGISCAIGTQTGESLEPVLGNDVMFIEIPLV